jgi:benzoylformate decarboxylase
VRVAVVTPDAAEAHRSAAALALIAPVAAVCRELARLLPAPARLRRRDAWRPEPLGAPLRAPRSPQGMSSTRLAARLPRDAVVFEETPSTRPEMIHRLPAVDPFGYIGPAMGGLGLRCPRRPASSSRSRAAGGRRRRRRLAMYSIQAL